MKDVVACDKPRGVCKQALIRGFPNGETRVGNTHAPPAEHIGRAEVTEGTETSKYLEEKKSIEILLVAASERRIAQTR